MEARAKKTETPTSKRINYAFFGNMEKITNSFENLFVKSFFML